MKYTRNRLQGQIAWQPDIILTNDDQGTFDVLGCDMYMTYHTPIVFAGVNYPNWELIRKHKNVTGWEDKIDIPKNIEFIKNFKKDHTFIFTLLDRTFLDKKVIKDVKEQLRGRKVVGFTTPELNEKEQNKLINNGYVSFERYQVRQQDEKMASLFWVLSRYSKDHFFLQLKRDYTTINIGKISANPCFTAINEDFGCHRNLMGGYFTSIQMQAKEEVQTAIEILRGKKVNSIPIRRSSKEYIIDWESAKNNGFKVDDIPSFVHIINISFKERHQVAWNILIFSITAILIFAFTYLLLLYLRERRRKKRTHDEFIKEHETLELAIQGSNTFAWTLQDNAIYFDSSFWKKFNIAPFPIKKEDAMRYIHPEYQKLFSSFFDNVYTRKRNSLQLLCRIYNSDYSWWELRYTTMTRLDGTKKTAGLLLDVQDFKDKEKELERTRLLVEKAELKQSFIASISHELRTPLNSIVGFSNIIVHNEDMSKDAKEEYMKNIIENNNILLKLMDEIFTLSQIDSGNVLFKEEKCSVKEIVNATYIANQISVPQYLEFKKVEDKHSLFIISDKAHLIEVLTHFINNASKFTTEGRITIGYIFNEAENEVVIYVEDSGKGIPKEEQNVIFSRFYKRDIFMQGAGLGLSICKQIIEKIGGHIEVQSEVGKGSRFSVILPCTFE
jgi:signal transduction histidine kinase